MSTISELSGLAAAVALKISPYPRSPAIARPAARITRWKKQLCIFGIPGSLPPVETAAILDSATLAHQGHRPYLFRTFALRGNSLKRVKIPERMTRVLFG